MSVVVTGGAGFIGSHLVQMLVDRGERVRVVERLGARLSHLPLAKLDVVSCDVRDAAGITRALAGATNVYHLAANPQLWTQRKGDFHAVNLVGTVNVLRAAVAAGATRVVHASTESILTRARPSAAITGEQDVPLCEVVGPYCRSKWRAERFAFGLAKQGAPIIVVNPTLPVGPGDWGRSPPTQMILDAALGKRRVYLDAELNLIDVRDAAAGMIAAMERGRPGVRYLLGAENWTIRGLFEWVAQRRGVPGPRWAAPYPVAFAAALVSEWLADVATHRTPAASVTGVRLTRRTMRFDARKSLDNLQLTPRPMEQSLTAALDWYCSVGWLPATGGKVAATDHLPLRRDGAKQ